MPVKSKAQWRFMGAVASGKVRKKGLSASAAKEWLHESKGSKAHLPERKGLRVLGRLKK